MYNGIYRGIVIDCDDPLKRGRVKVFVPHINMSLLEGWNKKLDEDKYFVTIGDSCGKGMSKDIHKRLRIGLPWAEVMMPVIGNITGGRYDETNFNTSGDMLGTQNATCDEYNKGSGAASMNENSKTSVRSTSDDSTDVVSKGSKSLFTLTGNDYGPPMNSTNFSNSPQKPLSVPHINAPVFVMFENGDSQFPIIVGSITRSEDHDSMHNRPIE